MRYAIGGEASAWVRYLLLCAVAASPLQGQATARSVRDSLRSLVPYARPQPPVRAVATVDSAACADAQAAGSAACRPLPLWAPRLLAPVGIETLFGGALPFFALGERSATMSMIPGSGIVFVQQIIDHAQGRRDAEVGAAVRRLRDSRSNATPRP